MAQDAARASADRVLFVYGEPDDVQVDVVESNLSAAVLRFHGRSMAPGSDALAPWVRLHTDAAGRSTPQLAWTVVCIALFTHPDFYSI